MLKKKKTFLQELLNISFWKTRKKKKSLDGSDFSFLYKMFPLQYDSLTGC